ncbi:MAG: response regulator transcription factor [Acidimicrobiia bacterium]|nr:response regulator transcription factor [Acidimicrobiia bacterium]
MEGERLAIRVIEEAAAYRRGLEEAFVGAGHRVAGEEETADLVLVSWRSAADCAALDLWSGRGRVLALVAPGDAETVAHALHHGAVAAVEWRAETSRIVEVAEAAARGDALLPCATARALPGTGGDPHGDRPHVDEEEVEWLEALARGATVVGLADDYGYSERVMFRRLRDLYERLGASNRSEALINAVRFGLLRNEVD